MYCTTRGRCARFGLLPCGSKWCQMIMSPRFAAMGFIVKVRRA
jgi:hypothetical protein